MREIYYAIYRSVPIDAFLNTLLAEAVLANQVRCTDTNVKPNPGNNLSDSERTVLDRITFGKCAKIKKKHILVLSDYYISLCIKKGYLKKVFLLGIRKTRRFKREINIHLKKSFNQNIIKYIDTKDTKHLKEIIKKIDSVEYPRFVSKDSARIGLYKDMLAMQNAAVDHRFGIQHPPPGR